MWPAVLFSGVAAAAIVAVIDRPAKKRRQAEERQAILNAIASLQPSARGFTIQQEVESRIGRRISFGMLYVYLDEFERDGLIWSKWGDRATTLNGHRPRIYFPAR